MLNFVLCQVQNIEKRIMSRAKLLKTYYVKCKKLKNIFCQVQKIEKRIMSSAKLLKNVLSELQTI